MNWIVLSQFFRFHSEPVVNVIGRTTTDIADTEIVNSIACLTNFRTVDFVQCRQFELESAPRTLIG